MSYSTRAVAGMALLAFCCVGCGPASKSKVDVKVDLKLNPSPPVVGESNVAVTLKGGDDKPVEGATVRLEGNMNHAGMKPSFADMKESSPGEYSGTLEFTMGGDWFILVSATLADGNKLEQKIDVPGVKKP